MVEMPTESEPVRIVQGDCLEVMEQLDWSEVRAVITDPPYGISLSSHGTLFRGMTAISGDESQDVGQAAIDLARGKSVPVLAFANPLRPWQGDWRQALVWDKGGAVGIGGDRKTCWKQSWELIQVGRFPEVYGSRDEAVLDFPSFPRDSATHPAAKSLELMRYLVRKLTLPGDLILDPFGGSGTTAVAAISEGRRCVLIESNPRHVETCRKRVAEAMGVGQGSLLTGLLANCG